MTAQSRYVRLFDSWQFWMLIAYFAIVVVMASMVVIGVKVVHTQADRAAELKASQVAQVVACVSSVRNSPDIQNIIGAIYTLANSSIISTQQALKADPSDSLTDVRKKSLKRLLPARAAASKFGRQIKARTPTIASCKALAERLNVALPRGTDE